jgi:hypothetical protein
LRWAHQRDRGLRSRSRIVATRSTIDARYVALPHAAIFDRRGAHDGDGLVHTSCPVPRFDAPYSIDLIVDHGENRWEFH